MVDKALLSFWELGEKINNILFSPHKYIVQSIYFLKPQIAICTSKFLYNFNKWDMRSFPVSFTGTFIKNQANFN